MKSCIITIILLCLNSVCFAVCSNELISIQVNISDKTFDLSYDEEEAIFTESDNIIITLAADAKTYTLTTGVLFNDGAGNFSVTAEYQGKNVLQLDHDHESWHESGLGYDSYFIDFHNNEAEYSLSKLKCDFYSLF
jgi:hypothetical protein